MSFVSNFFNTGLVDDYRSSYQVGSSEITNVFTTLRKLGGKGIEFDPEMDGDDENEAFLNGDLFLTFNWSASKQHVAGSDAQVPVEIFDGQLSDINPAEELYVGTNEEPEEELVEEIEEDSSGLRILPMMYPNSKNTPSLTGPVRALGVVETEDEKKKNAAMSFVQFLMSDEDAYRQAVLTAGCFPARRSINGHELTGLYGDDEVMNLYETLNEYYEYYDPTMELYPQLEEAWPELLREIGEGAKIKSITGSLEKDLNKKLEDEYGIKKIDMEE
jgi:ABC-type glycerol-3-phosphate transport system substrate-binding protein